MANASLEREGLHYMAKDDETESSLLLTLMPTMVSVAQTPCLTPNPSPSTL